MKRCPACGRTYADDQNFCFDDGTTLVSSPAGSFDVRDAPTVNYPNGGAGAPQTDMVQGTPTSGGRPYGTSPPPPPPPPPAYTVPYAQQQQPRRSPLPWIVGGLVVLVVGIAAALFIFRNNSGPPSTNTGGSTPGASPSSTPSSTPTTTTTSTSTSWETISEDGFSISMPEKPAKDDTTVPSATGPLTLRMYTLNKDYESYTTGFTEYPDIVFTSAETEDLINMAQEGALSDFDGEVSGQRKITVNGHPGREITGTSPSQNIGFTARVVIARPRMYMLIYTQYDKSKAMSADGKRFFDSFQITN